MGLGFAATRDLIAFLRNARTSANGLTNPLADIASAACERDARHACNRGGGVYDTAIAFGASQSGRYLRDFLWLGFNRDLDGERVFDGIIPFVAGGRRTFTNFRFSEPGRFSRQHEDHDVPGFDFPFAYAAMRDPITGRVDGIMRRCERDETCPRIFHVDTSGEFWQAGASLVGTGGGATDVLFPENMRAYMIASGSHGPHLTLPSCAHPPNPLNYTPVMRALIMDMVEWTTDRAAPPASRWPRLADGDLSTLETLQTPDLSALGVRWPRVLNRPSARTGQTWPVYVPTVDADGNDIAGIRLPDLATPRGAYLGWNLRKAGFAEGELCVVMGGFIPFAPDAASRGADPRLSLAERYANAETARERREEAIEELLLDRLLLSEDATDMREDAASTMN